MIVAKWIVGALVILVADSQILWHYLVSCDRPS